MAVRVKEIVEEIGDGSVVCGCRVERLKEREFVQCGKEYGTAAFLRDAVVDLPFQSDQGIQRVIFDQKSFGLSGVLLEPDGDT